MRCCWCCCACAVLLHPAAEARAAAAADVGAAVGAAVVLTGLHGCLLCAGAAVPLPLLALLQG